MFVQDHFRTMLGPHMPKHMLSTKKTISLKWHIPIVSPLCENTVSALNLNYNNKKQVSCNFKIVEFWK